MTRQVTPRLKGQKKRGGPARDKAVATSYHSLIIRAEGFCLNCNYECPCPDRPRKHLPKPACKLECAHIITRARAATRTDLDGAVPLCASCHSHFTLNPVEWGLWVVETLGRQRYDYLYQKAQAGLQETSLMFWRHERARLKAIYDDLVREAA